MALQDCLMCQGKVEEGMACSMPCRGGTWMGYDKDKCVSVEYQGPERRKFKRGDKPNTQPPVIK